MLALGLAAGLAGCGIGDRYDWVNIGNETAQPISVIAERNVPGHPYDRTKPFRLAPRDRKPIIWQYIDDSAARHATKYRVEARNASGELVFCGIYSEQQLRDRKDAVDVVAGNVDCPS